MKSTVVELRNEGFNIRTVDVRFRRKMVAKYRIKRVPTFVYVLDGEEVRRRSGSISKGEVRYMFRPPLF